MAPSLLNMAAVLSAVVAGVAAHPKCGNSCAADKCFAQASLPAAYMPTLSSFCYDYLSTTAGVVTQSATTVATATITETVIETITGTETAINTITDSTTTTPSADPATVTATETTTVSETTTIGTVCTTTTTVAQLVTSIAYVSRSSAVEKRSVTAAPEIPAVLTQGCKPGHVSSKVSSACSCILATAAPSTTTITVTTTTTVTATGTATASATATDVLSTTVTDVSTAPTANPVTVTTTVSSFTVVIEQPCTSTGTVTQFPPGYQPFCGVPVPSTTTSGSISCTSPAPAGQTNNFFRIEGGSEGTIFEGCISSGPGDVTTPSGGTHRCDGTNNNNNPTPGATLTTDIDAAGREQGFGFDGTWSQSFSDYFITRISNTQQTSTQFWGVLRDRVFTNAGGCQEEVIPGTEGLWAFDAFNANAFLKLSPQFQVVRAGETASVTVTVTGTDGNGAADSPVGGADVGGQTSDANGNVQIAVPTIPGCYQYKAQRSGSIRSNAFFLTVM